MSEWLAIVMPVYNEEEAIGFVIDKWVKALDQLNIDYTINPYNDGSKDSTWQKIQELKPECEKRFTSVQFSTQENSGTCKTHMINMDTRPRQSKSQKKLLILYDICQ